MGPFKQKAWLPLFLGSWSVVILSGATPTPLATPSPQPPTIIFNHSKHINEMGLTCTNCHVVAKKETMMPNMEVCGQCHETVSGDPSTGACAQCHTREDFAIVRTRDSMDPRFLRHIKTKFNHQGPHAEEGLDCAICHPGAPNSIAALDNNYPTLANCTYQCHERRVEPRPPSCARCHSVPPLGPGPVPPPSPPHRR